MQGILVITIDDYLNMSDWSFEFTPFLGSRRDFFWIESSQLGFIDETECLALPKSFRILAICGNREAFAEVRTGWDEVENEGGWTRVRDYGLSSAISAPPDLCQFDSYMVLDEHSNIGTIDSALKEFVDYTDEDYLGQTACWDSSPNVESFWKGLEAVNPYYYVGTNAWDLLIFRGQHLRDEFLSSSDVMNVGQCYREEEQNYRRRRWQAVGPECGPEKCFEPNCERLRIRLAIRCYLHQLYNAKEHPDFFV